MTRMRLWFAVVTFLAGTMLVGVGAQQAAPQVGPLTAAQLAQGLEKFDGMPITIDFANMNLREAVRSLSEVGGVNLFVDPSVPTSSTVDLKLTQVPWNKILDIVLRSNSLTYVVDGNVIRVLTQDARKKELTSEAETRKASEQAPALETARLRLNYATAKEQSELLQKLGYGIKPASVEFEDRTNMLVVKESPKNLADIRVLMTETDRPEPQVEISAQIVQMNSDTAKALGVQWGASGRVSPELGNTTGLAFPNNGTIGGRVVGSGPVTQGPNDARASTLQQIPTAVNLPATGATSAFGVAMGAINGAFNLDVALSALAHEGKAKLISQPKITTQNNKKAEITQGFEVPYQTETNNTVTVTFRDAALKLTVTPQITAANTVIMSIELENGTPDFSRAVNGNPSISTQRAQTQVQVNDGATTIIGGITQTQHNSNVESTPGIANIPLLGWLFKSTNAKDSDQELTIFITPRIIRD